MANSSSLPRLLFLVGGTLAALGAVLIVLYVLLKFIRKQVRDEESTAAPRRVKDEKAFMSGAVQGVITDLKTKEKQLTELLRAAERRAEELSRLLDNLGAMLPNALCVINREGLIVLWNPLLRSLLKADVWSRRHFEDVFGPDSQLAVLLRDCVANDRICQGEKVECATSPAETKTLCVSAMPWHTQHGDIGGVVCLLAEVSKGPDY